MARRVTVEHLLQTADTAVAALRGDRLVAAWLRAAPLGRCHVLALGKAAVAMAEGACAALGDDVVEALAVAPDAAALRGRVRVIEGAHPVPDARSLVAGEAALAFARQLRRGDALLLLLSGGASALTAAPVDGVTLAELAAATARLLAAGLDIRAVNAVRRRLTRLGGGKLAAATAARITVLALSDIVAGDDDDVWAALGSGPAAGETVSDAEAAALAARAGVRLPAPVVTPAREVARCLLATPATLLAAVCDEVARAGWTPRAAPLWSGGVEALADQMAALALAPGEVAVVVGEPTLHVAGGGLGGRAQHWALLMAERLRGRAALALALGSDGRDGPTPARGAFVDGDTAAAAAARGVDLAAARVACDSHHALARLGATLPAADTGTNLTDVYLVSAR